MNYEVASQDIVIRRGVHGEIDGVVDPASTRMMSMDEQVRLQLARVDENAGAGAAGGEDDGGRTSQTFAV